MADQVSGEKLSAQVVGNAFIQQYYQFLKEHPQYVHKFYNDSSVVYWPGPDGSLKSATNTKEIDELIMSSDHNEYTIQIITADAQHTLTEGVLVVVTGYFISKENQRKGFSQTFVLARQDNKAIFVMNDVLRFVDVHEPSTTPAIDDKEDKASSDHPSTHDSENAHDQPLENCISTCSEAVHDTSKEVQDESNIKDVTEEVPTKPPTPSTDQLKSSVTKVSSNVKDDIQRRTYASMVAGNGEQKPLPAPVSKAPAPSGVIDTPKPQATAIYGVSKESTAPHTGVVKNNNVQQAARGLYLRGLPLEVTKNGLLEVIKKFGRVRPEDIQFKRYEDGFCCGFVEFQTADSARNAVEAGKIQIGGREVHISYKKRSTSKGSNGVGRFSSGKNELSNGKFISQQNGDDSKEFGGRYTEYPKRNNNQKRDEKMDGEGWFFNGRNHQKRDDRVTH